MARYIKFWLENFDYLVCGTCNTLWPTLSCIQFTPKFIIKVRKGRYLLSVAKQLCKLKKVTSEGRRREEEKERRKELNKYERVTINNEKTEK